jgi:hypothetical protein
MTIGVRQAALAAAGVGDDMTAMGLEPDVTN